MTYATDKPTPGPWYCLTNRAPGQKQDHIVRSKPGRCEVRYSVGMPFDSRCVSVRTNADKSAEKWLAAAIEAVVLPAINKHKAHLRTVALEMLRNRFADQIRDMRKNCDKLEAVAASIMQTLEG